MHADTQTLEDLEVLHAAGGGRPLVELVDRCRTPAGRRRLLERLASPSSDPAILRRWFEALAWLADEVGEGDAERWYAGIPPHSVDRFTRYLDDTLASTGDRSLRMGRIETLWMSLREPELQELAQEGHTALREILEGVLPLARRIGRPSVPSALRVLGENLLGLEAKLGLHRKVSEARSPMRLLALDDLLRRKHRGDLFRFLSLVAELDLYLGLAALLREGWVVPVLAPAGDRVRGPNLDLAGAWHPGLPDGVRNDWRLGGEAPVQLLTGPNMAGKTTALRVLGSCTWLAHCGIPVPARAMTFAPLGAFHMTLHPRDDLASGVSLFLAELLRVRAFLEAVVQGIPTLGIFDELFRGTNPADAREATRRVVHALARSRNGGLVLSTHLAELAQELAAHQGVEGRFLDGEARDEGLTFDFRIRPGVSHQRLGLSLLESHGVDALLHAVE